MTKRFIENWPLLTAVLIYYAYCNLHYYYNEFKVDIYNYISNSELVLSFLPKIVVITATIGTYIISYVIGAGSRDNEEKTKSAKALSKENSDKVDEAAKVNPPDKESEHKPKKWPFLKKLLIAMITLVIPTLIFFYISRNLLELHENKRYELREYFFYVSFVYAFLIYVLLRIFLGNEVIAKYFTVIMLALIIYVGQQIGNFRKLEAAEVKDGVSDYKVSFKYDETKVFKTDSNLIFIGQTQSTLFLYNKKDSSTTVLNKSKIDSLIIR